MEHDSVVDILLIEDSHSDAEMTLRALTKQNIATNLVHLKDGALALDFIFATGIYAERKIENQPKVILLDLKMPKVNGLQVLEKLKGDKRTCEIPVVILTSSKEHPDVKRCYELGVNSYIVKPVEVSNFIKAISELGIYWLALNHAPQ
ncbi:MAG: response regulator [Sphingobacteriales bacterium JAD_PAG50586_3]|nr:MAG: response regulator [Sphingobacteriales bacterium JAD_PAG50586_3]